VINFTSKTVQTVLTEIAGLLVLTRILQFILLSFHEWRFKSKMKEETGEDYREVFTYTNFKRNMVENQVIKEEMQEIRAENNKLKQRLDDMERFIGFTDEKIKNS
jgi:hypothetical protein